MSDTPERADAPEAPATPATSTVVAVRKRALPPVPPVGLLRRARVPVDAAIATLEETLGGREKLVESLAVGGGSAAAHGGIKPERAQFILGLLADPHHRGKSLRRLTKLAGITLDELLTLYRDAAIMRSHIEAIGHIAAGLPAVAKDVMAKAVPYEETCYGCGGVGQITPEPTRKVPNPSPQPCPTCKGGGRLLHQPDLERQKLALTLGGLVKGGAGGLTVNVTQQQAQVPQAQVPFTAGEGLIQLQKLSESALWGPAPARGGAAGTAPSTPTPDDPED